MLTSMKLSYAVLSEAKLSNCFEVVGRPAPVAVLDWAWTYANRLRHNAKVVDPDGEGCAVTFDLGGAAWLVGGTCGYKVSLVKGQRHGENIVLDTSADARSSIDVFADLWSHCQDGQHVSMDVWKTTSIGFATNTYALQAGPQDCHQLVSQSPLAPLPKEKKPTLEVLMDGAVEAEHDEERRVDEGDFDEPTTVRSALAASVRLLADDDVARRFEATVRILLRK